MASFVLACACVSGCISAMAAVPSAVRAGVRMRRQIDTAVLLDGDSPDSASFSRYASAALRLAVRNGVPALVPFARALLAVPAVDGVVRQAVRSVRWRGFATECDRLLSVVLAVAAAVGAVAALASGSVAGGVLFAVTVLWAASVQASRLDAKRDELLREQVPDALQCLSVCFQAGLSLPQAFAQTAQESPSPAKEMFARVAHDVETGRSVDDALREFRDSSGVPELAFVSVALDIQHVCGGAIGPVLESAEDSVRRGLEMKRFLRTHTAQARLSAQMVGIMPVVLVALLSLASPGFMAPFFGSAEGLALFSVAVGMQVAGVMVVRRMLAEGVS